MNGRAPVLIGPRFDPLWFAGPGVVSLGLGLALGLAAPPAAAGSLAVWIGGVLLVDVAHVYASLYRTYFDPQARRLHRKRLIWAPIFCGWVGFLLHLESSALFWSVLAYLAVFHFIKQHVGFAMLYARAGQVAARERRFAEIAVWAGTLGPVIWWHANLPRAFEWFIEGDLLPGLPQVVGQVGLWGGLTIVAGFALHRMRVFRRDGRNPMLTAMVLLPAANWYLGIVLFNDDRVFTVTNVLLHGVPYLALVWVTGGRDRAGAVVGRARPAAAIVAAYYGLLLALAVFEEGLWDRLVWHDHPQLFGSSDAVLPPTVLSAVVALLTVPQATHYLLDRWIWKVGPTNPQLAEQLGFGRRV